MTCWDILEKRAKTERDKAVEAISEIRSRLEEQQTLCKRVQKIAEQYQEKIKAAQGTAIHFGDIQLYRTSLKDMQHAVGSIRSQIAILELELSQKNSLLTQVEIERQKYQKLVEREKERVAKAVARQEARSLDEISGQLHYRKSKLA
jgi:flagellar export protein FliJ